MNGRNQGGFMPQSDDMPSRQAQSFAGTQAFSQLIRDALEAAVAEGWAEMIWCDANFVDWPLGERVVTELLNQWAGRGRKLVLIASQFDDLRRFHHRFVAWRVTWDHVVECRVRKGIEASEFPSALWSSHWIIRRLDLVRSTGFADIAPMGVQRLREELDEHRRQSGPGFSATTLGL